MLTNKHIWENGHVVADWPCDVGNDREVDSNGSIEHVVAYQNKHYCVLSDWEGNVRWENDNAEEIEWNEEEQNKYNEFFNGNEEEK